SSGIDERGVKTSYTYNVNGSTATILRDDGGAQAIRFDFAYDANFPEDVISITPKNPLNVQTNSDWQAWKYDYYHAGSAAPGALYAVLRGRSDGTTLDTLATFTSNSAAQILTATSATGGITTYGYNLTTGALTSITYPQNSTSGARPTYVYGRDPLGRLTSITDPLGKATSFIYDNLDRITSITLPKPTPSSTLNFTTTYTYDVFLSGLVFVLQTDPNGKISKRGYDAFGQ